MKSKLEERMELLGLTAMDNIEGISSSQKTTLKDKEGYLYYLSNHNLVSCIAKNGTLAKFFHRNKYTYENINHYLKINNINLILHKQELIDAKLPLKFNCTIDGGAIIRSWNVIKNGTIGCDTCRGITRHTLESVREYCKSKNCEFISDEYNGYVSVYRFKCSCGNIFNRRLDVFILQNRTNCPECNGLRFNDIDSIRTELRENSIELLSDTYKDIQTNMEIIYPCGFKTSRNIGNIRGSKYLCPHCAKKGYKRDTKQFYKEVFEISKEEYSFNGEYINCDTKMNVTHNVCNHNYNVTPHHFINGGQRCPKCFASKGERIIKDIFDSNNIKYIEQKEFDGLVGTGGNPLRFDFAVIEDNVLKYLLEYDGEFHYKPINGKKALAKQQEHDRRKDNYCRDNCIELVRIPYWELDELDNIVEDLIKNK